MPSPEEGTSRGAKGLFSDEGKLMGRDTTYISQRDDALTITLTMADELLKLDAEVQALEAENARLKASAVVLSSTEQSGRGFVEQQVYEYGLMQLLKDCFYSWSMDVVQSPTTDEVTPCSFEYWRKRAYNDSNIPSWLSKDQLFDVLDGLLHEQYAIGVEKFFERKKEEADE